MDPEQTAEAVKSTTGMWTAGFSAASFFALLGILIRQLGPWRKIKVGADEKLRDDLLHRVETLERQLDRERKHREAERALDRHKLNNMTQCFDALLLLIEAAPEKASETVQKIKDMRAAQLQAEALEKAAIHAAEMAVRNELEDAA